MKRHGGADGDATSAAVRRRRLDGSAARLFAHHRTCCLEMWRDASRRQCRERDRERERQGETIEKSLSLQPRRSRDTARHSKIRQATSCRRSLNATREHWIDKHFGCVLCTGKEKREIVTRDDKNTGWRAAPLRLWSRWRDCFSSPRVFPPPPSYSPLLPCSSHAFLSVRSSTYVIPSA